ncbi:DUF6701 domain-containing protein [Pseudoalteromonas sp. YIC-827]|uniref:DUF6701 domain-containing protein n=1 Tax=Pseudoalteromonas qingdaonensis TaxID=3131913 RepID=A0ABU9MVP6_9GAMM
MNTPLRRLFLLGLIMAFSLLSLGAHAAPRCEDIFTGLVNDNLLGTEGGIDPIDLSNVPWRSNPWPPDGSTLGSGSYYFKTLDSRGSRPPMKSYSLYIAPGAKVTIYVNSNINFNNRLFLNPGGDASQLTIVVRGNVVINNHADINGLIFAAGAIDINNNNVVVGGLAANGPISIGNNNSMVFDPDAAANLELPGLCNNDDKVFVDHFRIYHQAQTVRCLSSDIAVLACADAQCSSLLGGTVDVQLGSNVGSLANNGLLSLSDGYGYTQIQHPSGGLARLSLLDANPPAQAPTRCYAGGQASNCDIDFVDAGLAFFAGDGRSSLAHMRAGMAQDAMLRAVAADGQTGACVARTVGQQRVDMALSCENPGSCQAGQQARVNGAQVALNAQGQSNNRSAVAVTFDSQGAAPLSLNYSDVGQIQLHAQLALAATSGEPAVTLRGSSNLFVSQPYAMAVAQVRGQNGEINPATQGSGDGFIAAGEPFSAQVHSLNAQDQLTPNFGREWPQQRASIELAELSYPLPNYGDASLLSSGLFSNTATFGVQQSNDLVWREAGSIRIAAAPSNHSYLGTTYVGESPHSVDIGRFYPKHFVLQSSQVLNTCSSFSYMGENHIGIEWLAQAQGADNRVLQNYGAQYLGSAQFSYVARNIDTALPMANLSSRLTAPLSSWQRGEYQVTATDALFSRLPLAQTDGPYSMLQLGLAVASEIDNRDWVDSDMDGASVATCTNCSAKALAGMLDMRYGRLALDNNFGSEFEPLQLPMRTEYWQGGSWVLNNDDNCTSYQGGQVIDSSGELVFTGSGSLSGGRYLVDMGIFADSQGKVGEYPITYPASDWLLWDWDSDNNADDDPAAILHFGRFRGNDRIIYWRERYR